MRTAARSRHSWWAAVLLIGLALLGCTTSPAAPASGARPADAASGAPPGATTGAAGGAPAAARAQPTATNRPPLRVAYVTPAAVMVPLWMAVDTGAFDREGVTVEMRYIQANAAVAALLAGEVDMLEIS